MPLKVNLSGETGRFSAEICIFGARMFIYARITNGKRGTAVTMPRHVVSQYGLICPLSHISC